MSVRYSRHKRTVLYRGERLIYVEADTWFRVTFVPPGGSQYEVTGRAISEQEALRLADETVDHVERIGSVRDYLVAVESIPASEATSGFGLVITKADGTTVRK